MRDYSDPVLVLALIAAFSLLVMILVFVFWQRDRRRGNARIEELLQYQEKNLLAARRESVEKSRSSLKGQIAEQLAPLLPGFLYEPADARFLGDPIDYVVFNGYTTLRDGVSPKGAPAAAPSRPDAAAVPSLEVVLLEVKQGGSALSPFQRAIAASVEAGRVRFEICRIQDNGSVSTETWRPKRAKGGA
jgi:predicted Holliday junction resolvase-like endonuclease